MQYAKLQDHRTMGSGEKEFQKFYHIWTRLPSWSCDLDRFNKVSFPFPMEALHEIVL